jgi:hypothetical protein
MSKYQKLRILKNNKERAHSSAFGVNPSKTDSQFMIIEENKGSKPSQMQPIKLTAKKGKSKRRGHQTVQGSLSKSRKNSKQYSMNSGLLTI